MRAEPTIAVMPGPEAELNEPSLACCCFKKSAALLTASVTLARSTFEGPVSFAAAGPTAIVETSVTEAKARADRNQKRWLSGLFIRIFTHWGRGLCVENALCSVRAFNLIRLAVNRHGHK